MSYKIMSQIKSHHIDEVPASSYRERDVQQFAICQKEITSTSNLLSINQAFSVKAYVHFSLIQNMNAIVSMFLNKIYLPFFKSILKMC